MNVTTPWTVENKGNTNNTNSIDNMNNIDNTDIKPACGSGKKYKQCHGK